MLRNRSLAALIVLVAAVFILRKDDFTPTEVTIKGPRLLQEASTVSASSSTNNLTNTNATLTTNSSGTTVNATFADLVEQKFCSAYVYATPDAQRQSSAADVMDNIGNLRSKNTFRDLINEGNTDIVQTYLKNFVPFFAALGVPLAIFTLLFILCIINWSCMCCPSCSVLRCGICDRPSTKKSLKFYTIMSILFSLGVLGAALGSIIMFNSISPAINGTICQSVAMFRELYDGKNDSNWFGINALTSVITELETELNSTRPLFKTLQANFNNLQDNISDIHQDLNNLQLGFINDTVTRAYFLTDEDRYNPAFTRTLGNNMTAAYDAVDTLQGNVSDAKSNFNTAANEFGVQREEVLNALESGGAQTADLGKDIQSALRWINDNGAKIQLYGSNISIGLKVALAILIGISGFSLLAVVIAFWSKFKYFGKFIHLSWFLIGIFMVICWISATLVFPGTVACVEACEVVHQFLIDPSFANKTMISVFGASNNSLKDTILICMNASQGSLIQGFAVSDKLGLIDTLNQRLDNSTNLIDERAIPNSISTAELRDVLASIANNTQLDDSRTLVDLNILTDTSSLDLQTRTKCANVDDSWVLNNDNCTLLGVSPILSAADSDVFGLGQNLCIPLESWEVPSTRDISTRYTPSVYANCPDITNGNASVVYKRAPFLQTFVNRFVQNRADVVNLVGQIDVRIDGIDQKANSLLNQTKGLIKEPFTKVKTLVEDLSVIVYDKDNGLLYNTQCSFVTDRIESLNNELCINLIPSIYHTAVALIFGAVMCTILTAALFFMSRKLLSKQTGYDAYRKTYPR